MINLKSNPRQKKGSIIASPIEIAIKDRCKKVVAGPMHSYAITEKKVYLWGKKPTVNIEDNKSKSNDINEQSKMVQLAIAVDNIATGPHHSFAWNSKDVYCWGSNENYELGQQQQKEYGCHKAQVFEEAIKNGYQLKQIQCGESHTIAIFHLKEFERQEELFPTNTAQITERQQEVSEESIQMFACGKSQSFQLTINSVHIIPYPVLTPCSFKHLTQVKSKSDFNVALCNSKVYTWGANLFSRLGNAQSKVRIPQQVMIPKKIAKIGIGNHHVFTIALDGQAYSWGKGDLGQLGIDRFQAESKPSKVICEQHIIDAACGDFHTLVLLKDKKLKSCGGNKNGVLGHSHYDASDKKKRCKRLQFVENVELCGQISMIACGNHHNLVLNQQGEVFGWGNNDYYQVSPSQRLNQSKQEIVKHSKKPLQIIIDEENGSSNRVQDDYSENRSISSYLEKLQNWKRRYNHFRQQKAKEEEILMKEYDQILSNIKKMSK